MADEQTALAPGIVPVWRAMQAAASTDPEASEAWQRLMAIRYEIQLAMARSIRCANLESSAALRPETFGLLVVQRGWTTAR